MPETSTSNKKRVNAYIANELYEKMVLSGESQTVIITKGIELYFAENRSQTGSAVDNKSDNNNDIAVNQEILDLQASIKELQEHIGLDQANDLHRIEDGNENQIVSILKVQIAELKEEIKEMKSDQKEQVILFVDQMKIKDTQIENLNNTLQNQVLNIHTLVNTKLLAENNKKPWYKFW